VPVKLAEAGLEGEGFSSENSHVFDPGNAQSNVTVAPEVPATNDPALGMGVTGLPLDQNVFSRMELRFPGASRRGG
jgi:hypothetical protein